MGENYFNDTNFDVQIWESSEAAIINEQAMDYPLTARNVEVNDGPNFALFFSAAASVGWGFLLYFVCDDQCFHKYTSIDYFFSNYWISGISTTIISYWGIYDLETIVFFITLFGYEADWGGVVVGRFTRYVHYFLIPLPLLFMIISVILEENYDGTLYTTGSYCWRFFG